MIYLVLISALFICTALASREQLQTWESACVKVLLTEIQLAPYF